MLYVTYCTDFRQAKVCVHEKVAMGANLDHLIYNMLLHIAFSIYLAMNYLQKISEKNRINGKGLVGLTDYQQMSGRLIKIENWDN